MTTSPETGSCIVGRVDSVPPGSVMSVDALGTAICLVRTESGAVYALRDNCTHEDYPLSDGDLDGFAIECPRHGSCFDVRTGAVLNLPATDAVETFPVEIVDGDVIVRVGPVDPYTNAPERAGP